MTTTRNILLILAASALTAIAQPTVAPTNATVGSPRGEDVGGYNITNTFETGYRFRTVGGNEGKYRSDVNFGNGIRLLQGNITVNSKDGHGHYFDELLLSTQGLGNDPYEYSSLRVAKNKLYRFDSTWRLNDYFNPALTVANGYHFRSTTKTLQDHNLVLLPQSPFKVFLGYSRVNQDGWGLSTTSLQSNRNDEFGLFADVRRRQDEYRLGFEVQAFGAKLSVMRSWEFFRDDTRQTSDANNPGFNTTDTNVLNALRRDEPYHGSTGSWRANILWDRSKLFNVSGRFTYAGGRRNFIFDESAQGILRPGGTLNRQTFVFGNARRPVTTGSVTISIFPTTKLTVTNHTAVYSTRMDGDATFRQLDNATLSVETLEFQYLGIRTVTNSTDMNYRAAKYFGVFAGYQFSDRQIRSVEQQTFFGEADRQASEQSNRLHAGRFGFRLNPIKPLTLIVDTEIGRADRPIYPTSEKNYHAIGGRIQYKTRTVTLSAQTRTNYNTNSASLVYYSAKSRTYSADASWAARTWLSFDASYSKLHLDTLGGIAYFFNFEQVNDISRYVSNIHTGYFGARIAAGQRAEITLGYTRVQDTGDGGRVAPLSFYQNLTGPSDLGYQSYPLSFDSPMAKFSLRLNKRIRWNAGYQHYNYAEQLFRFQNYRAHTGYTSLSWMF